MFTDEMKYDLIRCLRTALGNSLRSIILYGSVARGTASQGSDIDIAVIVNKPLSQYELDAFLQALSDLDMKYDRLFSGIDIEEDRYLAWGDVMPFYKNIGAEGVVLWKAA